MFHVASKRITVLPGANLNILLTSRRSWYSDDARGPTFDIDPQWRNGILGRRKFFFSTVAWLIIRGWLFEVFRLCGRQIIEEEFHGGTAPNCARTDRAALPELMLMNLN